MVLFLNYCHEHYRFCDHAYFWVKPYFVGAGDILCDFEGTYCNFKNPRNNAYNWISNTVIIKWLERLMMVMITWIHKYYYFPFTSDYRHNSCRFLLFCSIASCTTPFIWPRALFMIRCIQASNSSEHVTLDGQFWRKKTRCQQVMNIQWKTKQQTEMQEHILSKIRNYCKPISCVVTVTCNIILVKTKHWVDRAMTAWTLEKRLFFRKTN